MEFKCLEFSIKRPYYKIAYEENINSEYRFFSCKYELTVLKQIIAYISLQAYITFGYNGKLSVDDFFYILVKCYDCIEVVEGLDLGNVEVVEINSSISELIGDLNKIYYEEAFYVDSINDILLERINEKQEYFMFIETTMRLPKWVQGNTLTLDSTIQLKVTHGGVLIQGLGLMNKQEKKKIKRFYPKCQFYGEEDLFFDFEYFPAYSYSFEWTGKHIRILEVDEYEEAASEIKKSLVLGTNLRRKDICFPIQNMKELDVVKTMLRIK